VEKYKNESVVEEILYISLKPNTDRGFTIYYFDEYKKLVYLSSQKITL